MKKIYALALALITITTYAQQKAGDLSIQFSGNYRSSAWQVDGKKFKTYSGNIYVKIGKFFTPNLELGLKPNVFFSPIVKTNPKDANSPKYSIKTDVGLGLYGTYSFLTSNAKLMPYAGAELSYLPLGDESSLNLGPYGGVKYFLTEKINIDANLNAMITLASTYGNQLKDVNFKPTWTFNIGIGVLISRGDD